jgi:hypothetical protein
METFIQRFGSVLQFSYCCFDRIVINGYLPMFQNEANPAYFFRTVCGVERISQEILRARTRDYQAWVEGYALNHGIPIQWAETGVRKQDFMKPYRDRFARKAEFGVYYILKSMEQGKTFRIGSRPPATGDPNYRMVSRMQTRFTHYYFYLIDEIAGPMVLRIQTFFPFRVTFYLNGHNFIERELLARGISYSKKDNLFVAVQEPAVLQEIADSLSPELIGKRLNRWSFLLGPKFSSKERSRSANALERFYAVQQVEYCRNFIFQRSFPIRSLFERSCELSLYQLLPTRVANFFGKRITRRFNGKLQSVMDRLDQGQHAFRFYWKNCLLKQYQKESNALRAEVLSNNLYELGLRKSLKYLPEAGQKFAKITDEFSDFHAQCLSVHFDFDLFGRLSKPCPMAKSRMAGIRLEQERIIRLFEILLYSGGSLRQWSSKELLATLTNAFKLKSESYSISQLRYDLRKLRAHGLLIRVKGKYAYQLTQKGNQVALMFILLRKRVYGPISGSLFLHKPNALSHPSILERAYLQVDRSIDRLLALLAA